MMTNHIRKFSGQKMLGLLGACFLAAAALPLHAQTAPSSNSPSNGNFQGSVVQQQRATSQVLPLGLDNAIQRGLRYNLGLILQNESAQSAGGQRLQALQSLIPSVTGSAEDVVAQTNLQAEGLRGPGFPAIIGPYGYT
ncbi:MAG TPA: hypothetical protein VMU62_05530, partial [Acidobacteriaceae bacterium]|nr:hypothetical protein [Acidobacteriaceae bacterium]